MFLLCTHFYRYYKYEISKSHKPGTSSKQKKISVLHKEMSILTIIMIVSMGIGPIWGIFTHSIKLITNTSDFACTPMGLKLYTLNYYIGKGCMYLLFIMRLHAIYGKSAFGYKPYKLKILSIIICLTTFTLCVLSVLSVKPIYFDFKLFGRNYTHCNALYPDIFIMIYGFHEVIITLITLLMFIFPLKRLLQTVKMYGGKGTKTRTFGFKYAAIKV